MLNNETLERHWDSLISTRWGILMIMASSLILSFGLLKLRDYAFGPDLGMDYNKHKVDFERKLLEAQESNLRQIQKEE